MFLVFLYLNKCIASEHKGNLPFKVHVLILNLCTHAALLTEISTDCTSILLQHIAS